jgi:hypothetical protein
MDINKLYVLAWAPPWAFAKDSNGKPWTSELVGYSLWFLASWEPFDENKLDALVAQAVADGVAEADELATYFQQHGYFVPNSGSDAIYVAMLPDGEKD